MKVGGQHPGDDILPPADHHRSSDDRRIRVEPTFEEGVWEDHSILAQRRRPTESKARAREIPEPVGDRGDARLHCLVTDVDRFGGDQISGQGFKNSRLIAPRDKIWRHDDVILAVDH